MISLCIDERECECIFVKKRVWSVDILCIMRYHIDACIWYN